MFDRWYAPILEKKLSRPYVHILFGARQTGKSTLLKSLLPRDTFIADLSDPALRSKYLARPGEFIAECRALKGDAPRFVLVDEAQSVPEIFDCVQNLFDSDKSRWRFVLCGSSARKLRKSGANLLPGRAFIHGLHSITISEQPSREESFETADIPSLDWPGHQLPTNFFPAWRIEDRMAFGSLPGIISADEIDRADLLKAYCIIHLEEEMRREAFVRDWGAFLRFLEFAAESSGQITKYASISMETGISQPTVKSYYGLLEDMFLGFEVPAWSRSKRKNILSTPKFLFFDLGVRNAAAGLNPSVDTVLANPGPLFEQWVGIELWKRLKYLGIGHLYYQKTKDGAEVDFIVESGGKLVPIEVKWTENPSKPDGRHLETFIRENAAAGQGYVVCRCRRPMELSEHVIAIPWQLL